MQRWRLHVPNRHFTSSLATGEIPGEWRIVNVVPLLRSSAYNNWSVSGRVTIGKISKEQDMFSLRETGID